MRISVNSCDGCNKGMPWFTPRGHHLKENGQNELCEFVSEAMRELNIAQHSVRGVYGTRKRALSEATKLDCAIQWTGQGPVAMWLVIKEN